MKHDWRWMLCLGALALVGAPHAGAAAPARVAMKGVHYVYLIRHGAYDPEPALGDLQGGALNALGRDQVRLAGRRLAKLPVRFDTLVTSPFRRARESAAEIGRCLHREAAVDPDLHECTPTADRADFMKNHGAADVAACDSTLALAWARWCVPSPEADRHDLLVCHANVIRWFVSRAVAGDPRRWPGFEIANASLTILAVHADGTVRLATYSDTGHLPLSRQTWTGAGAGWRSAGRK